MINELQHFAFCHRTSIIPPQTGLIEVDVSGSRQNSVVQAFSPQNEPSKLQAENEEKVTLNITLGAIQKNANSVDERVTTSPTKQPNQNIPSLTKIEAPAPQQVTAATTTPVNEFTSALPEVQLETKVHQIS